MSQIALESLDAVPQLASGAPLPPPALDPTGALAPGHLAPHLPYAPGPFVNRPPVLLYIGGDSQMWAAQGARVAAGAGGYPNALMVASTGHHLEVPGVDAFVGDLRTQLLSALERVDGLLAGTNRFLAVVLRIPLTGDVNVDAAMDIEDLLAMLLQRDVWLTWIEPVDVTGWPPQMSLSSGGADQVAVRLGELGFTPVNDVQSFGPTLRLTRLDAARAVLMLGGDRLALGVSDATRFPNYGARLQLIIAPEALENGTATVSLRGMAGLGSALDKQGLRLRFESTDGLQDIDLAGVARQITAYRVDTGQPRATPVATLIDATGTALSRLRQACLELDTHLALSPIVNEGRAWLESLDGAIYRAELSRALVAFGPDSEPGAWVTFLLTLDQALQGGELKPASFEGARAVTAEKFGLGKLYKAEAMEFARLANDLEGASGHASAMLSELPLDIDLPTLIEDRYVEGTSRFLLANLLRRGGRYDLALEWINSAEMLLDGSAPSLGVERLHCRYARAVCAAMRGETLLEPYDPERGSREDIFARALIRMTNANAAWLVNDLSQAIADAEQARTAFDSIDYGRYAARADRLRALLDLWQSLTERRENPPTLPLDLAWLPGSAPPLVDLSRHRPSAAAGLLQFASEFRNSDAPELRVLLPPVLELDRNGVQFMALAETTGHFMAADSLRRRMHVPPGVRIPLLAD